MKKHFGGGMVWMPALLLAVVGCSEENEASMEGFSKENSESSTHSSGARSRMHPTGYGYNGICIALDSDSFSQKEIRSTSKIVKGKFDEFHKLSKIISFKTFSSNKEESVFEKCKVDLKGLSANEVLLVAFSKSAQRHNLRFSRGQHHLDSSWPHDMDVSDYLNRLLENKLYQLQNPEIF